MTEALKGAIEASIKEGEPRLTRTWPMLLATGTVGGIDVGMGVFALLLVKSATHSDLLGGLAFSVGFIALLLANSELFTENFLVPLAAVVARGPTVFRRAALGRDLGDEPGGGLDHHVRRHQGVAGAAA